MTDDAAQFLNARGEWIYYINKTDMFRIYKIRTDGTERTKLGDETNSSLYLNVSGDWIFYSNSSPNGGKAIYKMKTDGSQKGKINDEPSECIDVYDKWIYYKNATDKYIYRIQKDGTNKQKLVTDQVYSFSLINQDIFSPGAAFFKSI